MNHQTTINNLTRRFQSYDNQGDKYFFDISFETLNSSEFKCRRQTGAAAFGQHIRELLDDYTDVTSITVSDYNGKTAKAKPLNAPVTIRIANEMVADGRDVINHVSTKMSQFSGLGEVIFKNTPFEGFGDLGFVVQNMKNENQIERLTEKLNETQRKLADTEQELKTAQKELQESKKEYDGLENDYYTLEEHATLLKAKAEKNGGLMGMVGNALAATAKSMIAGSPSLQGYLAGLVPADALNGFINEANSGQVDEETGGHVHSSIRQPVDQQIDDSTIIFEWLQTLDAEQFNKVSSIIAAMRQDIRYVDLIIEKITAKT